MKKKLRTASLKQNLLVLIKKSVFAHQIIFWFNLTTLNQNEKHYVTGHKSNDKITSKHKQKPSNHKQKLKYLFNMARITGTESYIKAA